MNLRSITGQNRALRALKSLLKNRRIPPALLLTGPAGVGKAAAARAFAKALNCRKATLDACGNCVSCETFDKGLDPDVRIVDETYQAGVLGLEAGESAKKQGWHIDTLRHLLKDLEMTSIENRYKVAIIEDAHRLNRNSANAILKVLEEPPPRTLWILLTHRPAKLPATIRSRCQTLTFPALAPAVILKLLSQRGVEGAAAQQAAALCEGSMARALSSLQDPPADPAGWIKDPMAPFSMSDELPRELHLSRSQVRERLHQMAWYLRRSRGVAGYTIPAVRAVQRELAGMHRALACNADPKLVLELSALRLQQLDIVLSRASS